jgi:hypothetical protein
MKYHVAGDKSHMPGWCACLGCINLWDIDVIRRFDRIERRNSVEVYSGRSTGAQTEGWVPAFEKSYPLTRLINFQTNDFLYETLYLLYHHRQSQNHPDRLIKLDAALGIMHCGLLVN